MNKQTVIPKLSLYHPNAKGTGAAIQFEFHPAHGFNEGAIFFRLAQQISVGDKNATPSTLPHFDWKNTIVCKLGFVEVSEFLQVFRGECESIREGKGLYFRSANGSKTVSFKHILEPIYGYLLNVNTHGNDGQDRQVRFTFSPAESLGLCEAFSGCLKEIAFGTSFEATAIQYAKDEAVAEASKNDVK